MSVFLLMGITACGSSGGSDTSVESKETTKTEVTESTKAEVTESTEKVSESELPSSAETEASSEMSESMRREMVLTIDGTEVPVTWENNDSVKELAELASGNLTIEMSMYGGFEQVGPIGQSITKDDAQTTTSAGDIVLYSGNQLVVFYGSNSWSYTRLGKINLSEEEMTKLLGDHDVTITISVK